MNADTFNGQNLALGVIAPYHVTAMTRIAQAELGLPVDGKCGPRTRAALEAQSSPLPTAPPDLTTAAGLMATYPDAPRVAFSAVEIALACRGKGEEGENNHGAWLRSIGSQDGFQWCAVFAGHPWREAHRLVGLEPPAWAFRREGVAEPGALALCAAAAGVGEKFMDPDLALPGDLMLWRREGGHHVGLVWHPAPGGITITVEGNVGRFPAPVREMTHDTRHEPHFMYFARPYHL